MAIQWIDRPSDAPKRFVPIIRAGIGPVQVYGILSPRIVGCVVHWCAELGRNGRLIPHEEPVSACYGCKHHRNRRRHFYLGVWDKQHHRDGVLELPEDAVRLCPALQVESVESLRGRVIRVWRDGPNKTSPVRVAVEPCVPPAKDIAAEPDVRAVLERLWGVARAEAAAIAASVVEGEQVPLPPQASSG